jgi:hypothetical protein
MVHGLSSSRLIHPVALAVTGIAVRGAVDKQMIMCVEVNTGTQHHETVQIATTKAP